MDTSVAVIGLGSRGLSVLERIVTLAKRAGPGAGTVRVDLVDPRGDGAGVHATDQPDYLLLNTTAAQVSMFPDAATVGSDVDAPGPSLYDWVTGLDLRMAGDGFTVGAHGRPIRPHDFLPRRVLGEYLGWFLEEVRRRAPSHVDIRLHRAEAVDITDTAGGGLSVALSGGSAIEVRYAFLTTGYTGNVLPRQPGLVNQPYPLPQCVAGIRPGQTVAIGGFGLSAMDLMSCFTVGRGGRFVDGGYVPSGQEPTLLFYSRSGAPCRARPKVVEFGPRYEPLVFTPAALDARRADRGGRLDFEADVLPLVLTEMRVAYRRCQARLAGDAATLRALSEPTGIAAVLDELDRRLDPFDVAALFDGTTEMLLDDSTAYQKWLADALSLDLAEGVLGFTGSPVKAALDVLRELRDTFRHAVDFRGLTDRSLDEFHRRIVPALNRAVVGPQHERHSELLALMAAGIAQAPFGPQPSVRRDEPAGRWRISSTRLGTPYAAEADWLVAANVSLPAVRFSASPLIAALAGKGALRPYRPGNRDVPGVDVDADQHPLDAQGEPDRRLWILGPLCEGATFYNNLAPSPGTYSRPIFDAHRCVAAMFAAATA